MREDETDGCLSPCGPGSWHKCQSAAGPVAGPEGVRYCHLCGNQAQEDETSWGESSKPPPAS